MELIDIVDSPRQNKRFRAIFRRENGRTFHRDFGSPGATTFADIADPQKRAAYLARHGAAAAGQDWNRPDTPGALSRWILWERPNMQQAVNMFRQRFGL